MNDQRDPGLAQDAVVIDVHAGQPSSAVCRVEAGDVWRFTVSGAWGNPRFPCGPDGYRIFLLHILDIRPKLEDAPWFCVIGRYRDQPGTEFRIGSGAIHRFETAGEIEFLANDHPKAPRNKKGRMTLTAQKLSAAPEAPSGPGEAWRLVRETFERTTGLLFIAVMTVGVGCILRFMPQGQDLIRSVSEGQVGPGPQQIAFGAALFLLSMQAWFWLRVIVNFNYGSDRDRWRPRWFLEWTPRILGLAPGALSLWAMTRSPAANTGFSLAIAAVSVLFFALVLRRNDVWKRMTAARVRKSGKPPPRVGRLWVCVWLVIAVVSVIVEWFWPVRPARYLGAPAVVFIGVALIIPPVVIAIQTGASIRFPVLATLFALALVFSLDFDNHRVGRRAGAPEVAAGEVRQIDLDTAYRRWRTHAHADPADGSIPIVLAAAEGGASRAGYWTGEVLSQLHARTNGRLADSLFAISSVSGGSVGALGYAAALQDYRNDPAALKAQVNGLTGADALSPAVGGLLFTDLLQRFLPIGFPDRAEALERSWEDAWRNGCGDRVGCAKDLIAGSFLDIWRDDDPRWTPLVIINGASEEVGRRIVTSKLALRADQVNVDDFFATTRRNIAASTAIHNGARFPIVSPAGTVTDREGAVHGHIVDGGYFDPAGTEVVRELAHAIVEGPGKADADRLKFIFVFIGYGTSTLPPKDAHPQMTPAVSGTRTRTFANELRSPLGAMVASRAGHAEHMARNLKADVALDGQELYPTAYASGPNAGAALRGSYVPILLCNNPEPPKPGDRPFVMPMDWALSNYARGLMGQAVTKCGANALLMSVVADTVNRATGPIEAPRLAVPAPPARAPAQPRQAG